MQVYPMDCQGCSSCANVCPAKEKALVMKPLAEVQDQENANLAFALENVEQKTDAMDRFTLKGSQFQQPLLEFSGACAGCGETPYVKLLTQLFGERMVVANATGCSSIWGASSPVNPYTTNKDGHGPAWGNSLFEDAAEYGLGMHDAYTARVNKLVSLCEQALQEDISEELKEAIQNWLDNRGDGIKSKECGEAVMDLIFAQGSCSENCGCVLHEIAHMSDLFTKKSFWIFGGDGWGYDIGFGGVDHVLASGADINILIMDTEVYSNTGGQASKATPLGSIAQFAASGKPIRKKDIGRMMMSYGYVYVAYVSMGADMNQVLKAFKEAEAYHGPSLIVAYAPCINQGIRKGMGKSMEEAKLAVKSGYWPLYRFNPELEQPFSLDSKEPDGTMEEFMLGENRFAQLESAKPELAKQYRTTLIEQYNERYAQLKKMAGKE